MAEPKSAHSSGSTALSGRKRKVHNDGYKRRASATAKHVDGSLSCLDGASRVVDMLLSFVFGRIGLYAQYTDTLGVERSRFPCPF